MRYLLFNSTEKVFNVVYFVSISMKKTTVIDLDTIIKDFMQLEHVRPLNNNVQDYDCIKTRLERNVVIKDLRV